ncbi:MAG: hypothetical protein LBQ02_03475 [Candidatus Nomurabacteria bacterium]|jgi:hypothetical protein|nr:hypothetical protein [Candidatus Nomurabacteria bacterium]
MFSSDGYRVYFEDFTARHFIKNFEKKYKGSWLTTRKAIVSQLRNVDMLINSGRIKPPIHMTDDRSEWIIKYGFAIAGLRESPKNSGRRIIAYVNDKKKVVRILLVYHKGHLGKGAGETNGWKRIVRLEYKELLRNFNF